MLTKKHHTKLIMATVFGVFFLTAGLATGAYLATKSQDTRNQAWGGNRTNFRNQDLDRLKAAQQKAKAAQGSRATKDRFTQAQERMQAAQDRIAKARQRTQDTRRIRIDGKDFQLPSRNNRNNQSQINLGDYQKYLTQRNCDYESYGRFCTGNTLRACTRNGREVKINCSDFDATCGVIPVGKNAGKAACIPNDIGKNPLPGNISFEQAQKYIKGSCSNKGVSSCSNNVMTACTPNGTKLVVPCADVNATCGVIPAGKNAGKAACIPNDLPEIPDLGDFGSRNGGNRNWPKVTVPTISVPSISPLEY